MEEVGGGLVDARGEEPLREVGRGGLNVGEADGKGLKGGDVFRL